MQQLLDSETIKKACEQGGLSSLGILSSIVENPLVFKSEMCYKEQVISNEMSKLFCVTRSEVGSNRYELESLLLSFWEDLLVDVQEGGRLIFPSLTYSSHLVIKSFHSYTLIQC